MAISWELDPSWTAANRCEIATIGEYELIAIDLPATPRQPAVISWEIYGPPGRTNLLRWGKCATFDEAKVVAEAALKEIRGNIS
jgi:hypothetical protein